MKILRATAASSTPLPAGSAPTDRVIPLVASTDTVDSYNEIVDQSTWKLERFLKNPVALTGHAPWEPAVGFYRNVRVEDGALRAELVLYTADVNPESERIWKRYCQGGPVAFSVGFDCGRKEEVERGGKKLRVLYDNTLTEISVVTLGANPDAVADARRKAKARRAAANPRTKGPTMSLKSVMAGKGMTAEQCAAKAEMPMEDFTALMDGGEPSELQLSALAKAFEMSEGDLLAALVDDEADEDVLPVEAAKGLLKALGVKTVAEAMAKIRAQQDNAADATGTTGRLKALELKADQRERDELLRAAREDGRLTPAREKRSKDFIAGQTTAVLKTYLETLEPVVGAGAAARSPGAPPAATRDMPADADMAKYAKAAGVSVETFRKSAAELAARNASR